MAAGHLAPGGAGGDSTVGVDGYLPAVAVDAHVVVEPAEQLQVRQAGLASVGSRRDMVRLAGGGRLVAAGPGAVAVASDHGSTEVVGDRVGLADVEGQAGRGKRGWVQLA